MTGSDRDTMQTFVPGGDAPTTSGRATPGQVPADQMQTLVPTGDTVAGQPVSTGKDPMAKVDPMLAKLLRLSDEGKIDFDQITKLGEGGMGLVCKAHQISLDREVALKLLKEELAKNEQLVERFIREARAMAKINHPNVVQGYAVGETEGLHWVAMELIDGESMQDVLDRENQLTLADAVTISIVAAEALQHAHEMKMIHRDIKPDNILVTADGQVKVADLGLAKAIDEDMSMTQSGTGLGTPHYMPPEQARNAKHVDARSDIYALGCTLHHFLVGAVPFAGESVVELIMNKEKGKFEPANRLRPEVPERLSLVVEKMMAIKPEQRYQTMEAVIADLQKFGLTAETLSFVPNAAPVRRSGGSPTVVATGLAATAPTLAEDRIRSLAGDPNPASKTGGKSTGKKAKDGGKVWYLMLAGKDGAIKRLKAPHGEVLAKLRAGKLDPARVKVAPNPKGPYLTLAEVPAFSRELEKRQRKTVNEKRSKGLASEMAKIDKQYGRRKWWNFVRKIKDGTLGLVGLLLYLGAIGVVLILGYLYLPGLVMPYISGDASSETSTAAESPAASDSAATPAVP